MTVAVIIPALNEARLIGRTLSHTAALGFDEIIVVDGGSTDQTFALVESFVISTSPHFLRSSRYKLRLHSNPVIVARAGWPAEYRSRREPQ